MIEKLFQETAILMLFTLPMLTTLYSIFFQILIKDKYIVSGVCLVVYLALTLLIFEDEFIIWALIYTALSFIISWIIELVGKEKRRNEKEETEARW